MKYLRQYIRQILKEETASERDDRRLPFVRDLLDLDFDTNFKDDTDEDYASEEEIAAAYRRMAGMGRKLKQAFADHADREYLDSLKYVHWTTFRRRVLGMLAHSIAIS